MASEYNLYDPKWRLVPTKLKTSSYMIMLVAGLGAFLLLLNIVHIYYFLVKETPVAGFELKRRSILWVYANHTYHLRHVMNLFEVAGYESVTSSCPPVHWDVMWAFDFPFTKEFKEQFLHRLEEHQKVNHLPGTGFLTLKVELATSRLKWIPQAYSIPTEKHLFIEAAKKYPRALWVQKSNYHRGIKIVHSHEVDIDANGTFTQEFVANPLLIDNRKFDIGIYVVYTSVNPLRVYLYFNEILVRFCPERYHPMDVKNTRQYVVGDDYTSLAEMRSLQGFYNHGRMSSKNALFTYMKLMSLDTRKIWDELNKCIAQIFISKEMSMDASFSDYSSKHGFFELVRVDFVIDAEGNVWLMEVNMSPNLASIAHPANALMYEQVIYNTLALVGLSGFVRRRSKHNVEEFVVQDRDIIIGNPACESARCLNSCSDEECLLCDHCMSGESRQMLKQAYLEHIQKGNFRRVLPAPMDLEGRLLDSAKVAKGRNNVFLQQWFREKCKEDSFWCQ